MGAREKRRGAPKWDFNVKVDVSEKLFILITINWFDKVASGSGCCVFNQAEEEWVHNVSTIEFKTMLTGNLCKSVRRTNQKNPPSSFAERKR